MTEIPVVAEIVLSMASFRLPSFRMFESHRGSNIRQSSKQKYRRDQKISGVSFAMAKKTPGMAFRPENGETTVSACRFPPDLFRTIDPWHGSIVRKSFGAASIPIPTETTINRRAHGG
jgi:hypothetical protein